MVYVDLLLKLHNYSIIYFHCLYYFKSFFILL